MKKFYHSIKVLTEPIKSPQLYLMLYLNGYIYLWSANLGMKRTLRK